MKRRLYWIVLVIALAGSSGCASSGARIFVNPDADMTYYEKVAIVSFTNLTQTRFAGQRVTRAIVTELIISGQYSIVQPGEFNLVLARVGGEPDKVGNFDPARLRQAAEKVGATGIIKGAVTEFQRQRSGTTDTPVVGFDIELIDVESGGVVWRASVTRRGKSRFPVVGGAGLNTFGKLVQAMAHDLVKQLEREGY